MEQLSGRTHSVATKVSAIRQHSNAYLYTKRPAKYYRIAANDHRLGFEGFLNICSMFFFLCPVSLSLSYTQQVWCTLTVMQRHSGVTTEDPENIVY